MTSERTTSEGWRRFSLNEMMGLAICAEVRRHFSLPLEQIRNLYQWLSGKKRSDYQEYMAASANNTLKEIKSDSQFIALRRLGRDQFLEAMKDDDNRLLMENYFDVSIRSESTHPVVQGLELARIGMPVYLVGLDDPSLLSEFQLVDFIRHRLLRTISFLCLLNNIFNEVLAKLQLPPFEMDKYSKSHLEYWDELQKGADLTKREREVINLIRAKTYHRVIVHVNDSEIYRLEQEEDLPPEERESLEKAVLNAIGSKGYQTVVLSEDGGRLHRLTRRISKKLK